MNKLFIICLMVLMLVPLVSGVVTIASDAHHLLFKQGEVANVRIGCFEGGDHCDDPNTMCNISALYPNGSILLNDVGMSDFETHAYWNYSLPDTSTTGIYPSVVICSDAGSLALEEFEFQITGNGKYPPGDNVIVMFSLLFLIFLGLFTYTIIHNIENVITKNYYVKDVALSFGVYFMVFGLYMLQMNYLGYQQLDTYLLMAIKVGAVTHMFIPVVALFYSFFIRNLTERRGD